MPQENINDRINQRITEWKQRLIDLTRRNKLLYFQSGKGPALTIEQPGAEIIFEQIYKKEKPWYFWLPPMPKKEKGEDQSNIIQGLAGATIVDATLPPLK